MQHFHFRITPRRRVQTIQLIVIFCVCCLIANRINKSSRLAQANDCSQVHMSSQKHRISIKHTVHLCSTHLFCPVRYIHYIQGLGLHSILHHCFLSIFYNVHIVALSFAKTIKQTPLHLPTSPLHPPRQKETVTECYNLLHCKSSFNSW